MAVIRDVIPPCEFFQPTRVEDALQLLERYGRDAWVLAGGLDSLDWLKDRIKRPRAIVDLGGVAALKGIQERAGGLEIGAMTTLTEVVRHPLVLEKFSILTQAAEAAASPQIRNQGTLGGNVSQDTRCWYYRSGWPCYRASGNICYADAPEGMNREHAIFEGDRCVAVNPSDTAPALIALDATMVIRNGRGEREIPAERYWIGPGVDITRMTILKPGELLTAIRIPATWAGARFYFEKVADRKVWDFPLVNLAAAFFVESGRIARARLAANGVAPRPLRLRRVEEAILGRPGDEETADLAGRLAIEGARPLQHNAYKVPLLRNLVRRAVRSAAGPRTT